MLKNNYCLINKLRVYNFTSVSEIIDFTISSGGILIAINAEKILHTTEDTKNIINSNIGYSDGIGAVWALKKKGCKNAIKIPGCELWLQIIQRLYKDKTFYLVGGKQKIIDQTVEKLKKGFIGINILNYRNGYFNSSEETRELLIDIREKKPDVVFVAMGSPKQELLMEKMQKEHPNCIYQGLGGSFDVYIGNVKRAPEWWIKNNLEWAYRLIKQPKRIVRQIYFIKFLWLIFLNKI